MLWLEASIQGLVIGYHIITIQDHLVCLPDATEKMILTRLHYKPCSYVADCGLNAVNSAAILSAGILWLTGSSVCM